MMLFMTSDRSFGIDIAPAGDDYDKRFFSMKAVFPEGSLGSGYPEIVAPDIAQLADLPIANDVELDPSAFKPSELLSNLRTVDRDSDRLRIGLGETFDFDTLRAYRYRDYVVIVYEIGDTVFVQQPQASDFDDVIAATRWYVQQRTS